MAPAMHPDELRIHSYLSLGYFIDYVPRGPFLDLRAVDRRRYAQIPRARLVERGVAALRETFGALHDSARENVIPLSGGLDSRLILGALREHTEARNLHTFSFGIPGSYDYDIGCLVAKHAGTRHLAMPLDGFTVDEEELANRARRMHAQVIVFQSPVLWALDRLYPGARIWSGYVNDAVGGSHLAEHPSRTLDEAKARYLEHRRIVRSTRLDRAPAAAYLPHLLGGGQSPEVLTYDEQVLFDEGVQKFTAPIVLQAGFDFVTPFINTPWMDLLFSVPNEHRLGQSLMRDIGARAMPDLWRLPTKSAVGFRLGAGRGVRLAARALNRGKKALKRRFPRVGYPPALYNDFDERFRDSPDLVRIARSCLHDLRRRGVVDWIDLDGLWSRHQRRLVNAGDALGALVSLEIVLREKETKP